MKSRPKILKILSAAPSNSTTSISSNGNSVNPLVPRDFPPVVGTFLNASSPTCRINDKFPSVFQPSKCERTQRRILHDSGACGLAQQPHVVLVSAPHQPAGGANAVPHHCGQRDPGDHRCQPGELELKRVNGRDSQDIVLQSLAIDYAVSIPTLKTSAFWIFYFFFYNHQVKAKGNDLFWVFFYFLPLPVFLQWGGTVSFP